MILEKTLESPLDSKDTNPVNPKGKSTLNSHWKNWCWSSNTLASWCEEPSYWRKPSRWERLRAGREADSREWDGWMVSLNGHEFKQALGDSKGQGSLVGCSPWDYNELDTTQQLNNKSGLSCIMWNLSLRHTGSIVVSLGLQWWWHIGSRALRLRSYRVQA